MEAVTQLKKFRLYQNRMFLLIFLSGVLSSQLLGFDAFATSEKIPVLNHVGIIPSQWQGQQSNSTQYASIQKNVDIAFSQAVRDSKRFRVLNDDLIKSLWETYAGRQELKTDYELSAYASLAVVPTQDTIIFVSRLLNPEFELFLQESHTVTSSWAARATYDDILKVTQDLIFKLFNRLPIDASVTSVQGRYITISGGLSQGVHMGDTIQIVRSNVISRHPANKTWLDFASINLGIAKIIEVKKQTSVAQLVNLTKESAIEIGDGAKLKYITGRSRFAREKPSIMLTQAGDAIMVPPLYSGKKRINTPPPQEGTVTTPASPENQNAVGTRPEQPADGTAVPIAETTPKPSPNKKESSSLIEPISPFDGFPIELSDVRGVVSKIADNITFKIGQKWWWYIGPGATGTTVKWYLPVNQLGVRITREILPRIKYDIGGGISFGGTHNDGSYFAYDSHIRAYWEDEAPDVGAPISKWKLGVQSSFSGIGTEKEAYGGNDLIMSGIFGGVHGRMSLEGTAIDWFGEFSLNPLTFGRVGYKGSRKTVRSSFGWSLSLGGFLETRTETIEWGGSFNYTGHNISDSSSTETGLNTVSLQGLARYRF